MSITVPFKIANEQVIIDVFELSLLKLQKKNSKLFFSNRLCNDLKIAFMEGVANAVKHAGELAHHRFVEGRFLLDDKNVGFEIYDQGKGFDIDLVPVPDLNNMKASGRGIFMMKQLGEEVSYKKQKKRNTLTFKRNLIGHHASTRELDLLYELSEAIISHASKEEVYQIILSQALELFHVERASILIYDDDLKRLKVAASRGISENVKEKTLVRSGEGVSGYVFQHARPLLIEDVAQNTRGIEKKEHYKTGSFISAPMICSPLRLDEKPIGVINLTDRADGKRFTKKDLKLLSTIANQAMACLHIRNLVEEAKEKERLKQEMEQVRIIQSSYLPTKAPDIPGFDIAGRCEMAKSVGGDYFDYYYFDPFLFLVVADVAGHDTSSAVTMVNFRSQLKAYLRVMNQPDEILNSLNQSLYDDLSMAEQFVSCLLVRIHTQTGEVCLANAGHYPPLCFPKPMPLVDSNLVLGVDKKENYQSTNMMINKGDGMLLFTDGVVESMNKEGSLFGMVRVEDLKEKLIHSSATHLVNEIVEQVMSFRSKEGVLDDVTVLGVKRLGL